MHEGHQAVVINTSPECGVPVGFLLVWQTLLFCLLSGPPLCTEHLPGLECPRILVVVDKFPCGHGECAGLPPVFPIPLPCSYIWVFISCHSPLQHYVLFFNAF